MDTPWKFLGESVVGTSHFADGSECQDTSFVTPYGPVGEGEQILIAICSDGAGSAKHAAIGSKLACRTACEQVVAYLDQGGDPATVSESNLQQWVGGVHERLVAEAESLSATPRDLACTLLLALIGQTHSAFVQIGDGTIITRDEHGLRPVFWPQNGEYQNTTFFVTDMAYADRLQVSTTTGRIDDLALITDGLQSMALNMAGRTAHAPFFEPMLQALREQPQEDLVLPMREFLGSAAVNARTDDDKTLILATRAGSRAEPTA